MGSLERVLLVELLRRSRMAVILSVPVCALVAFSHLHMVTGWRLGLWLSAMLAVLLWRYLLIRQGMGVRRRGAPEGPRCSYRRARLGQYVAVALTGFGWGATVMLFDTGTLDFLLLFKLVGLSAILGTAMTSFGTVFPIYSTFVASLVLPIFYYLATGTDYLAEGDRVSLAVGVCFYTLFLLGVAWHFGRMNRIFFQQQAFLMDTLSSLEAASEREKTVREALEANTRELSDMNTRLTRLAALDGLTGIANRRTLVEHLDIQVRRAHGEGRCFSVILLDIDKFKGVNDTYGHQVGDQVLIGGVQIIEARLRETDLLGRWGGEEFLCLLPDTPLADAVAIAERLRAALAEARLIDSLPDLRVTASFGVATLLPGEAVNSLIAAVDLQLYGAKDGGRNQVRARRGQPGEGFVSGGRV